MIETIADLKKLLKLCREQGVTEINLGSVSLKLGDLPFSEGKQVTIDDEVKDPYANFPQGILTPEQEMFYSSGGMPEDDPFRKDVEQ